MPRPLVEVEGARKLRATLAKAGRDLGDLKAAHADAGRIAETGARGRVPRLTGTLAGTIRSSGTKTAAIIRAGRSAVPYAGPIHWGWPGHNILANPFLTDGAQDTEHQWVDVYERAIDEALDQIKGI